MNTKCGAGHLAATLRWVAVASFVVVGAGRSSAAEPERADPPGVVPRIVAYELTEMSGVNAAVDREGVQPLDARPLVVISDQEIARGSASGVSVVAGAEAIVYENTVDTGNWTLTGQRFNYAPTMSSTTVNSAGFSIPTNLGTFIADGMFPGAGWQVGDPISSFSAFVRRSGTDPTRFIGDGTARATLTLWDGDPVNLIDTTGDGYTSAPIPGASCDFTLSPDVPFAVLQNLRCNLAIPITPAHGNVWLVLTSDSCRLFWPITLRQATVGFSRDRAQLGQDDDAGRLGSLGGPSTAATDGNCCSAGAPACGPNAPLVDCPNDTGIAPGRCSDGDAETHLSFNFGGPCVGDPALDSCVNYLAQINAPAKTTISLVPVGGTGKCSVSGMPGGSAARRCTVNSDCPVGETCNGPSIGINGNEITYAAGGGTVTLEVRIGNWDPDGTGVTLQAWSADIDPAGYTSALAGTLAAVSIPCTSDFDCIPIFGGACAISGDMCLGEADCNSVLPVISCTGPACGKRFATDPAGSEVCLPAYITRDRSDYVFAGLSDLPGVDLNGPSGAFRYASKTQAESKVAPSPFPAEGLYAATLQLDISSNAKGTFTLGMFAPPASALVDDNGLFIPLIGLAPAKITILTGQCCDAALSPLCVSGTVSRNECSALGGFFDPTKTCTDVCECFASTAAVPEQILNAAGAMVTSVKNRFLSFSGGGGFPQAVRVKFVSLPGAFSMFDGTSLWVDTPTTASELSGKRFADPVGADSTLQVSGLSATPVYADWSTFGVVHVFDERIIPSRKRPTFPLEPAIYEIQLVSGNCDVGTEANFSPALSITNAQWGDIGDLSQGEFRAPDGSVGASDLLAVVATFSGSGNAPIKARAELLGNGALGPVGRVDGRISISDILAVLSAFSGGSYPFAPPTA